MLDFLVNREWPFESEAPKPRYTENRVTIEEYPLAELIKLMPDWAIKERAPHTFEGLPIWYRHEEKMFYLDGRRRMNTLYQADPNQLINIWVITSEIPSRLSFP